METIYIFLLAALALGTGFTLGYLLVKYKTLKAEKNAQGATTEFEKQIATLTSQNESLSLQNNKFSEDHKTDQEKIICLEKTLSQTEANLSNLNEKLEAQTAEQERLQKQQREQFENLATRIMNDNSKKLEESSGKKLSDILTPLKERLSEFHKKVDDVYNQEARERFSLKKEIERITEVNKKMSEDTTELTKALKGDSKTQGNWGEIVLERVLEASGLREGQEYTLQGKGLSLKTEDGRHQKPDVVINLPENKHIIVDSKVSLTDYERFLNTAQEKERETFLKQFHTSIQKHIDELSAKKYDTLEGLNSPELVLLFMPIEAAFSTALQTKQDLFSRAWDKKIVIVSPTTLLATLRTVASIWRTERQEKNAMEIANRGGQLYDKFVGFVSDLEEIGKHITNTQKSYDSAINKISTGRGNLMQQVKLLEELGAKTSKKLPEKYLTQDL